MRKITVLMILLAAIPLSLCANNYYNSIMGVSFRPHSLRYKAMGESGLAIATRDEALFSNAAALSDTWKFSIDIPNANISLFQAEDILSSPLDRIFAGDIDAILNTVAILNGTFPLLIAEESISTSFRNFAIALHFRESLYSTGQSFASGFIPALQATLSFGYGHRFAFDNISLKLGAVEHISGVFYSSPISAEAVIELLKGKNDVLELNSSSWNFSTDLGAILELPKGFSLGIVFNDISRGINFIDINTEKFTHSYSNAQISLSSGWEHHFGKALKIAFSYDLVNLINLFENLSLPAFLYHSNFGSEISIYDFISLYAGLNGGYPSFGLELNVFFINMGILYRYLEFGNEVGINPKDQLEIHLALSF